MRGWDGAEQSFATDFLRAGRMPAARYTGKMPVLLMGRMPMLREGVVFKGGRGWYNAAVLFGSCHFSHGDMQTWSGL